MGDNYVSQYQNNGDPILEIGDYLTKVDGKSVADEDLTIISESLPRRYYDVLLMCVTVSNMKKTASRL